MWEWRRRATEVSALTPWGASSEVRGGLRALWPEGKTLARLHGAAPLSAHAAPPAAPKELLPKSHRDASPIWVIIAAFRRVPRAATNKLTQTFHVAN